MQEDIKLDIKQFYCRAEKLHPKGESYLEKRRI